MLKTAAAFLAIISIQFFSAKNLQASSDKLNICSGEYALCTGASCVPVPGQPDKLLCHCSTQNGYSAGLEPCVKTKVSKEGYKEIKSRYYPEAMFVKCSNNRTWANCLDSPCIVDANNPFNSLCTCKAVSGQGDYVVSAKACNSSLCQSGIWSGSSYDDSSSFESQIEEAKDQGKFPKIDTLPCS